MSCANSSNLNQVLEQHTYSYDKNSNIVSENVINNYPSNQAERINETRSYTYDNLNRLVASTVTDNNSNTVCRTQYTYDKNGNRTSVETDDTVSTYVYNDLNQLVSLVAYNKQPRTIVSKKIK